MPAEEVPAELPEPCLGINFARDGMAKKDWLALVAVHSDAWLLSVAFYYGAKLDASQRCALSLGKLTAQPRHCPSLVGGVRPGGAMQASAFSTHQRRTHAFRDGHWQGKAHEACSRECASRLPSVQRPARLQCRCACAPLAMLLLVLSHSHCFCILDAASLRMPTQLRGMHRLHRLACADAQARAP